MRNRSHTYVPKRTHANSADGKDATDSRFIILPPIVLRARIMEIRCVFCTFPASLFAHRFSKPQSTAEATNKYRLRIRIRSRSIMATLNFCSLCNNRRKKKKSGVEKQTTHVVLLFIWLFCYWRTNNKCHKTEIECAALGARTYTHFYTWSPSLLYQ